MIDLREYPYNDFDQQYLVLGNERFKIFSWWYEHQKGKSFLDVTTSFWVKCTKCDFDFKYGTAGQGQENLRDVIIKHYKKEHIEFLAAAMLAGGGWNFREDE